MSRIMCNFAIRKAAASVCAVAEYLGFNELIKQLQ